MQCRRSSLYILLLYSQISYTDADTPGIFSQLSSWTRRSIRVLRKSEVAQNPKCPNAALIHDPASGIGVLPVELVYAILDEVHGEDSTEVLRNLSRVNRFLHRLVEPRLWQSFEISDAKILDADFGTARQWRKTLKEMCAALVRDPIRAVHVKSLSIIISGTQFRWSMHAKPVVRDLRQALLGVPSLRSLRVEIARQNPYVAVHTFTSILTSTSLPFQLTAFTCTTSMEPGIYPFLASQSAIERYTVNIDSGYHWLEGQLARAQRTIAAESLVPSLLHYYGPPSYARAMTRGRNLEMITVHSRAAAHDLEQAVRGPSLAVQTLAHVNSFRLIIDRDRGLAYSVGEHLPALIQRTFGISITSIRTLQVDCLVGWKFSHGFDAFPPSALRQFPQLESLEWTWTVPKDHALFAPRWTHVFIRSYEKNCATLRRVCLLDHGEVVVEFLRVPEDAPPPRIVDYSRTDLKSRMARIDGEFHAVVQVPNGSMWTLRTEIASLASLFYRDTCLPPRTSPTLA